MTIQGFFPFQQMIRAQVQFLIKFFKLTFSWFNLALEIFRPCTAKAQDFGTLKIVRLLARLFVCLLVYLVGWPFLPFKNQITVGGCLALIFLLLYFQ